MTNWNFRGLLYTTTSTRSAGSGDIIAARHRAAEPRGASHPLESSSTNAREISLFQLSFLLSVVSLQSRSSSQERRTILQESLNCCLINLHQ